MLELLGLAALVVLVFAVGMAALKALFWLLILPFKLAFWLVKGAFALFVVIPVALIAIWTLSAVFPVLLLAILLPVLLVVGGLFALFGWAS